MDKCSYFIKDRAMFGSFPTQQDVIELENEGTRYFVNLTHSNESKITPYFTNYTQINYPIYDRRTPNNWESFSKFIIQISDIILALQPSERVYIHCKGGHGRSGVVVACLLCYIFKLTPKIALEYTSKYHSNRSSMREKWRNIGSPQTSHQKRFVYKFFEPLKFYRSYRFSNTYGFSNFSPHPVTTDLGTFPTSEALFQAHKSPYNIEYVEKQKIARSPIISKNLGIKVDCRLDWNDVKYDIMYNVIKTKIQQHPEIKQNLLNTNLRPIIYHTHFDSYWGIGDGQGQNMIGEILEKLRTYFYFNEL